MLNPNKTGLFERSLFSGGQFDPFSYLKNN